MAIVLDGRKRNRDMKFNQGDTVDGLIEDLLYTIHKYDEVLYMATVVGALEFVKLQLIYESKEIANDE
jgi:hypothetical protein